LLIIEQTSKPPTTKPTTDPPPPSPTESVQVITESGGVVTRVVTLTPSAGPTSSSAPVSTKPNDDGPNVGAIAGGVAGGVIGLLALIGGLIFVLWRRRKQQQQEALDAHDGGGSGGITRNTSTMSKAGLLGGASTGAHPYPPRIATNMSSQNSRYGVDQDSISPNSNRRNSQPLVIDSRLNPNAVMTFAGANLSRESVASLDDSRDYGRQLNVRNPDPHY
jgi:cell wall integrity and stress response component